MVHNHNLSKGSLLYVIYFNIQLFVTNVFKILISELKDLWIVTIIITSVCVCRFMCRYILYTFPWIDCWDFMTIKTNVIVNFITEDKTIYIID